MAPDNLNRTEQSRTTTHTTQQQSTTDQTKEKAGEVAQQAQERAKEVAGQAQEQAKSAAATGKERAAGELDSVAQAFRETSHQLRDQDQQSMARYSNEVADRIEQVSTYLHDREVDELMHDAEDLARRQPELFLGAAFTAGLLFARFLKSSQSGSHMRQQYDYGHPRGEARRRSSGENFADRRSRDYATSRPYSTRPGTTAYEERDYGQSS